MCMNATNYYVHHAHGSHIIHRQYHDYNYKCTQSKFNMPTCINIQCCHKNAAGVTTINLKHQWHLVHVIEFSALLSMWLSHTDISDHNLIANQLMYYKVGYIWFLMKSPVFVRIEWRNSSFYKYIRQTTVYSTKQKLALHWQAVDCK